MDFPSGHDVVFAFDFDGVICDSVRENAHTTWRAVCKRWPQRAAGELPAALLDDFVRCRPVIETGYQNIALMRALLDGATVADILAGFHAIAAAVTREEGLDDAELERLFGAARDQWLAADPDAWLAAQGFYAGVPELVNRVAGRAVIITTKQYRFAVELVARAGIDIDAERVYGLEKLGRAGKRDVLEGLAAANPGATVHFFEDRLATLDKLTDMPRLSRHLVDWGYNTPSERERAAAHDAIELLDLRAFALLLEEHAR